MCASAFTVEPDGLQFLASHSFDFNRLIKLGIPYASHDCGVSGKNGFSGGYGTYSQKDSLRILWNEILCSSIPIAFHNGLIDLAFIYEHFYSTLPETLDEFVANLSDWFILDEDESRPGLYDSKYLAEFVARMNASYLEYVFRKCSSRAYISVDFDSDLLRTNFINSVNNDQKSFEQINCELPEEFREPVILPRSVNDKDAQMICKKYAAFGFCPSNRRCYLSHNIDLVLDLEEQKQSKVRERRKRRYDYASKLLRSEEAEPKGAESTSCSRKCSENEDDATNGHLNGSMENEIEMNNTEAQLRSFNDFKRAAIGCHRAGMDSFMTGFAVIFMSRMAILRTGELTPEHGNRLPLRGKPIPLLIHRSEFTMPTAEHCTQWERISIERERRRHLKNIQLNGIS
ncbi:unnamed protein product [Anisakis simplex]|uniref:C3H1-type domain-containing protein n=1 Tax=Anisakis simplex TaxID=6269 RepID=A0A3P6T4M3_ANISI|nr:unnamed protein product [Anisakis simplex]